MLDALQGESWSRVVSLIDVHTTSTTSSGSNNTNEKKSKHSDANAVNDTSRMKDILIGLKSKPLPPNTQ